MTANRSVLFYSKDTTWTWNPPTEPYTAKYLERFKWDDQNGDGPYRKTLLKTYCAETEARLKRDGRWVEPVRSGAMPSYKQYLKQSSGSTQLDDVWTDINMLNPQARERLGYPTQKPEALLQRIIEASSNAGDVVLDPFCGCGTTVAVAERLQRQWIGIDVSPTAIEIMRRRLIRQTHGLIVPTVIGAPTTAAHLMSLAPFEFQNWVINAMSGVHSPRLVHDMGIDGYSFISRDPIQVKRSEHVGRNVLDNFETAMRRGRHDLGYIVAFSFTEGAREEAARARADGLTIRLLTVSEVLLLVKRPESPPTKFGPQPGSVVELPLPPMRKQRDMPSARELVASDQQAAAG